MFISNSKVKLRFSNPLEKIFECSFFLIQAFFLSLNKGLLSLQQPNRRKLFIQALKEAVMRREGETGRATRSDLGNIHW
jgi:hypothetical protein